MVSVIVVIRLVFFEDGVLRSFIVKALLVRIGAIAPPLTVFHASCTPSLPLHDVVTVVAFSYYWAGVGVVATSFPAKGAFHRRADTWR